MMTTSYYPYLIRAFYQWMIDNTFTPVILLNVSQLKCPIPPEYLHQHEMAFNISPQAVRHLNITNHSITFQASLTGMLYSITAPIHAILAIYAEENENGLLVENNTIIFSGSHITSTSHRAPDLTVIETHCQTTTEESP